MSRADDLQAELLRHVVRSSEANRLGSVQHAFEQFFLANPDEELTYADIRAKFGINDSRTREVVKVAKKRLPLESVHVVRMKGSA